MTTTSAPTTTTGDPTLGATTSTAFSPTQRPCRTPVPTTGSAAMRQSSTGRTSCER